MTLLIFVYLTQIFPVLSQVLITSCLIDWSLDDLVDLQSSIEELDPDLMVCVSSNSLGHVVFSIHYS